MRSSGHQRGGGGGYYGSPPPHPYIGGPHHYPYGAVPPAASVSSSGLPPHHHRGGGAAVADRLRPAQFTHHGGSSSSLQYDDDSSRQARREYLDPPKPRSDSSQAKLWSAGYMRPFTPPTASGRNVECCILVRGEDGALRKCGATLKHNLGASTTNLLKHIKVKHPEEAKNCLQSSKHSGLYKAKRAIAQAAESGDQLMWEELGIAGLHYGAPGRRLMSSAESARQLVLFCAFDLHPWWTVNEPGCRLLLGNTPYSSPPAAAGSGSGLGLTGPLFDGILIQEHATAKATIKSELKRQRSFILFGPPCSLQIDTWPSAATNQVFAVMSVTFVNSSFKWRRLGLSVQAFATHYTCEGIQAWVSSTTAEFFGAGVQPSSAYLVCTIGNGDEHTLREAVTKLGVPTIQCSIHSLARIVNDGMAGVGGQGGMSNLAAFTDRVLRVLSPLLESTSGVDVTAGGDVEELHQTLQKALAPCMMDAMREKNLTTVLGLFQRVLVAKPQLERYLCALKRLMSAMTNDGQCKAADDATGAAAALTLEDWYTVQDGIGVLEACAEVDQGLRSAQVVSMPACASLLLELQQYLSEDLVYVPELSADPDLHRLEKPASELQEPVQVMRSIIAERLTHNKSIAGRMRTKEELLATLLNPCHKDDATQMGDAQAEEAWAELTQLFRDTAGALASLSSSECPSTSGDMGRGGDVEQHTRFVRRGSSSMGRKMRRISESAAVSSCVETDADLAIDMRELDRYRALPSLDGDQFDSLAWWSERVSAGAGMASATGQPEAVLPYIAAQYYSIDPSSIQAASLFERVDFRVAGLQATELPHKLHMMLLLRLNRDIIQ